MSGEETLVTSPLLFGHRGRSGQLVTSDPRHDSRFRLSDRAAAIVLAFLEPRSIDDALEDGFGVGELDEARAAGILVTADEAEGLDAWESNGWSRPAHLLFSSMDVPYIETDGAMASRAEITTERRAAVADYLSSERPPEPRTLAGGEAVELPPPPACDPALARLTGRRSARAFSASAPSAEQLAATLHAATSGLRLAAVDRAGSDDPLHRLNSYGSWAHLFVVIQAVEGLPSGSFEYDVVEHRLVRATGPVADGDLVDAINGQPWILGPGFVVFFVAEFLPYAWLYRYSRAYVHLLIQAGYLGQELLMAATAFGLAGWTSPAVHESSAAALLGLPNADDVDVVSMVKLGRPLATRGQPQDR